MLLLDNGRKSYIGSSITPLHLTFSDHEKPNSSSLTFCVVDLYVVASILIRVSCRKICEWRGLQYTIFPYCIQISKMLICKFSI